MKKYWRTTHKFGIEVLNTVEYGLEFYHKTVTAFLDKAIKKDIKNVRTVFDKLDGVTTEHI